MTRTTIRHTIFTLATLALLTAFTSLTVYAQSSPFMGMKGAAITSAAISGSQSDAPGGLATNNGSQEPTMHRQFSRIIVKKLDGVRKAR